MSCIIIGSGLTNNFLNPESRFRNSIDRLSSQEIGRLMGSGKEYGAGPLPTFLNGVASAKASGNLIDIILINSQFS